MSMSVNKSMTIAMTCKGTSINENTRTWYKQNCQLISVKNILIILMNVNKTAHRYIKKQTKKLVIFEKLIPRN